MAATASFHVSELEKQLAEARGGSMGDDFQDLEYEVQTDKERVKLVTCRECGRPLVVSTFYVPANARCSGCKGETGGEKAARATIATPQPGRTDPAKAVDLRGCLINKQFGFARCPTRPDDEEHEMELKSVSHSDTYGPSELTGYKNGIPQYRQKEQGETVLHQCLKCKATVAYSTTAQMQFRRQNEARSDKHVNGWVQTLGARPESESEEVAA